MDKSVTKDEFDKFISEYPRKLERHVIGFYEPPLVTWNDFTLGEYPDFSIVAFAKIENDGSLYDFTLRS